MRIPTLALVLAACAAPPQEPTPDLASGPGGVDYEDGFVLRSGDGRRELKIGGLFQTTFGAFHGDRDPSSDAALKRMRPEFSGSFEGIRFNLEPNFSDDGVELEEAWVGTDLWGGDGRLMFGRMKAPFSLEEVRSRRHIDFPAFSLINQFVPAEDHGVFLKGKSHSHRWEYGLAAYNGTGSSDTNSSKDLAGRLMVHPFAGAADSPWTNLQLGLAATWGVQDADVGGDALENEAGLEVVRFAPGAALAGRRTRVGLEAAWFDGPWFLQAEWIDVRQEMEVGAVGEDARFQGGYLTLSRVLTGESKNFAGVRPDAPFDFSTGAGRGAWILALRLSTLAIDDDLRGAFTLPGEFTERIDSTSLGLNWVPNDHAILRHALIWSRYDDELALGDGSDDGELSLVIELQLHF